MENTQPVLSGSNEEERAAYLGAIASIATADREATPQEIEFITALCTSAGMNDEKTQLVLDAANEPTGKDVTKHLDVLKKSELRYSLIADLIAFAKSDNNYSEEEEQSIHRISEYLGLDEKQYTALDQFVTKASSSTSTVEEVSHPDFLSSLGLKDKFQNAGINGNSLLKGLLSFAGPMILAKMVTGGLSRNRSGSGMFSGAGRQSGLGSVISMINGGRGLGSIGGLFSRIFGR